MPPVGSSDSAMLASGERTIVLLGAGASADAGLPLTTKLASQIVEAANQEVLEGYSRAQPDWLRALNMVYSQMVGYQGARGDNPLRAVNIETLISAVRLLSKRDEHEVAPFVASWTAALDTFGSTGLPPFAARDILSVISEQIAGRTAFGEKKIGEAIARIAVAAVRPDLSAAFKEAERQILWHLVRILGKHEDVSYLQPLLDLARSQPGGVDVITLNYDLTVETAATAGQVQLRRGMESWIPGTALWFPPVNNTINLMKLHGSLDWEVDWAGNSLTAPYAVKIIPHETPGEYPPIAPLPWIVVGDREKLATEGPTLALNFAAQNALLRASHLAVVGYSFSDSHINAMIRDWISASPDRTISILSPEWPSTQNSFIERDFRSDLVTRYGRQQSGDGRPIKPRLAIVSGKTAGGLRAVLEARPSDAPDPLAEVTAYRDEHAYRLVLLWHGEAVTRAHLSAEESTPEDGSVSASVHVELFRSEPSSDGSFADDWENRPYGLSLDKGGVVTMYAAINTGFPLRLSLYGSSAIGQLQWHGYVMDA